MSTVYTFYDAEAGAWRNRLSGREPFPRPYRDRDSAAVGGRELAYLFGAEHFVCTEAMRRPEVPKVPRPRQPTRTARA